MGTREMLTACIAIGRIKFLSMQEGSNMGN